MITSESYSTNTHMFSLPQNHSYHGPTGAANPLVRHFSRKRIKPLKRCAEVKCRRNPPCTPPCRFGKISRCTSCKASPWRTGQSSNSFLHPSSGRSLHYHPWHRLRLGFGSRCRWFQCRLRRVAGECVSFFSGFAMFWLIKKIYFLSIKTMVVIRCLK